MNILRYDGSFYGLISVLAPYLKRQQLPDGIERDNSRQPLLFAADEDQSEKAVTVQQGNYDPEVFRLSGVSRETWQNAWHAFLSEAPGIELAIARYLLLALEKRGVVESHMTDERVQRIHRLAHKVVFERHRFMGLLRFRAIGVNLYYASINSDNFILPILAPFFVERFADQQWIIHDRKRELAAIYDMRAWTIIERAAADLPAASPEEDATQGLWQCFFDSIAVRERLNLALQQKFIPKKYWQDLVETPGR
ncbi:MAG: hypothetical protein A2W80_09920 [Candidatus Riflebacteria bacterium GWC2_50_8]|nr:MAG: hypothetical protein A2W80_09920 [Candidatus Riflebacteria bacterium GWC2_50_8]